MSEIPVKAKAVPAQAFSNNVSGTNTSSPQKVRNCSGYSMESAASIHEITLIDNMTSFLKAHGGAKVDENNLREMAEALSHMNCTSPGTLQDVTMDNSYSVGYRSPCVSLQQYQGTTSPPVQGRSVREFEEQMASLRKENFNLKLRLYFIEESIPGYQQCSSSEGHETIMKQLIDTKVEMEILRKEIQEKQEILKEAALAMNQMEKIQKETETKSQEVIDELKQKIQFLEMERDMDKSHQGDFMNELLGRSDLSENLNALQKIRELEGIVKQSDEKIADFQRQISKLENDMNKRDEAIKEYEEKVKELVFQNAELLEAIENKEKDITTAERNIRGLRMCNADLKEDNHNLIDALKATQDTFRKEMSNMKVCERQMREQQDILTKMQSTISIKTANTARLLERIQDYEKMVTTMNLERNIAKRENRFFRAIIGKLQRNNNECYTIEKEEIYQQIGADFEEKPIDLAEHFEPSSYRELKARADYHSEYKLKKKLYVNFSNTAKFSASSPPDESGCVAAHRDTAEGAGCDVLDNYLHSCCHIESETETEFPIRYTISDANLFSGGDNAKNSCSSLQPNVSGGSLFADTKDITEDLFYKEEQRCPYPSLDGIRYVYSKFGNFH